MVEQGDNIITYADYGYFKCNLKKLMNERKMTKTLLVKKTGLHHNVVQRYLTDEIIKYDKDVLAKLCYVLNCDIEDLITYVRPHKQ